MKVLFVDHGSKVSGAQRSLLELLKSLPGAEVACPSRGPLAELLAKESIRVRAIPETRGSFKLHPVHTTRMAIDLLRMAMRVRRYAFDYHLVHANSVRAGLACALVTDRPVVVHVRDTLPSGLVARIVRRLIRRIAAEVVANSEHTRMTFGGDVTVVHNPIDLERFRPDGAPADIDGEGPLVGVVGQISPWKGQDVAIEALPKDARLIVVGEAKFVAAATRFDNRTFERELHELAKDRSVQFLGEREDVPELMRACDVVLVPSWEEPAGRVVVEAMACGVPVIATDKGGPPEVIEDGVDGILLPPRRADLWQETLAAVLADGNRRERIGQAAAEKARQFGRERHALEVEAVYERAFPDIHEVLHEPTRPELGSQLA